MSAEPVISRPHPIGSGTQRIYRFPNGYGASVIDGPMFYTEGGTLEVAVLHFPEGVGDEYGKIDYTTPLTSDVLGRVDPSELDAILSQIAALPEKVTA